MFLPIKNKTEIQTHLAVYSSYLEGYYCIKTLDRSQTLISSFNTSTTQVLPNYILAKV